MAAVIFRYSYKLWPLETYCSITAILTCFMECSVDKGCMFYPINVSPKKIKKKQRLPSLFLKWIMAYLQCGNIWSLAHGSLIVKLNHFMNKSSTFTLLQWLDNGQFDMDWKAPVIVKVFQQMYHERKSEWILKRFEPLANETKTQVVYKRCGVASSVEWNVPSLSWPTLWQTGIHNKS